MTDAHEHKVAIASLIAGHDGLDVWFVDADGEPHSTHVAIPLPVDEFGIGVGGGPVPWQQIFALGGRGNHRFAAFLEHMPPLLGARAAALRGGPLEGAAAAALRSWPLRTEGLRRPCEQLSEDERRELRVVALEVLEERDAPSRGLSLALGFVGDAGAALRVGDLLCAIDDEEDVWRWTYGLEALRLIGTRDAHTQIQRVSMQSPNPPTITAAREKLLHIAGDLGVPVWEVQDELVPSCGLDECGRVELDYGDRRFELHLDDALEPLLFERPGHERYRELPTPGPGDAPNAAAQAQRRWAVVREQIAEAIPVQVQRFEEALAQQTRWSGPQWNRIVRRHPLLTHLMPRAIWGRYSKGGRKLLETFRVTPERTTWGPDDEPVELDLDGPIGLPHPCEIDAETLAKWGEVLADYEVVTMFPQIDRAIYRPADERKREQAVPLGIVVPGRWALVLLHRRGWREHEGWGTRLEKVFRSRDVRAVVDYQVDGGNVVLSNVHFERYLGYPQTRFQLRDVAEVAYSETLYELELLRMPQETGGWPAVVQPHS